MAGEIKKYPCDIKIKCPFFVKQDERKGSAINCGAIFEGQIITRLVFQNKAAKFEHFDNFCFTYAWKQCPLACAIEESLHLQGY